MIKRTVIPPYDGYELSTFVTHDDVVYIGHIGGVNDEDGNVLSTTKEQMEQTLKNLEEFLGDIDLDLNNVVKLTVILKDIDDFRDLHEVWKKYFSEGEYPVRTVITSDFVNDNILVQVEGIACRED
ncbi:MAG: RidA family protein [Thermoplasmatota archaeon]